MLSILGRSLYGIRGISDEMSVSVLHISLAASAHRVEVSVCRSLLTCPSSKLLTLKSRGFLGWPPPGHSIDVVNHLVTHCTNLL